MYTRGSGHSNQERVKSEIERVVAGKQEGAIRSESLETEGKSDGEQPKQRRNARMQGDLHVIFVSV